MALKVNVTRKKAVRTEQEQIPVRSPSNPGVRKREVRTEQEQSPVEPSKSIDVRLVPIDTLQLWGDNPWDHKKVIPRLAEALAIHGQVSAVIVWRKNNTIYKGNHTYRAIKHLRDNIAKIARNLGMSVDEILENIDPRYIKAEFRDFASENAATAYGLSDNNLGQGGKYDDALLLKILQTDEGYFNNNSRTGFTEKDLKAFELGTMGNVGKLANTDIVGESAEMGEFSIVLFPNVFTGIAFKEAFGMAAHERKVEFEKIMETMTPEWQEWFQTRAEEAQARWDEIQDDTLPF